MKIAFYKGTRDGVQGFVNRAIRWWTNGPYSHVELVLNEAGDKEVWLCASSSGIDGGVRFKAMSLAPERWDIVDVADLFPNRLAALDFFRQHEGAAYDFWGIFGFVWRRSKGSAKRWFCSEAVAASLQIAQAWRFDPNTLYVIILALKNKGTKGHAAALARD